MCERVINQADMFSVSFSLSLANVVRLTAQCHISVPFMATHNILYLKSGSRYERSKAHQTFLETLSGLNDESGQSSKILMTNLQRKSKLIILALLV